HEGAIRKRVQGKAGALAPGGAAEVEARPRWLEEPRLFAIDRVGADGRGELVGHLVFGRLRGAEDLGEGWAGGSRDARRGTAGACGNRRSGATGRGARRAGRAAACRDDHERENE